MGPVTRAGRARHPRRRGFLWCWLHRRPGQRATTRAGRCEQHCSQTDGSAHALRYSGPPLRRKPVAWSESPSGPSRTRPSIRLGRLLRRSPSRYGRRRTGRPSAPAPGLAHSRRLPWASPPAPHGPGEHGLDGVALRPMPLMGVDDGESRRGGDRCSADRSRHPYGHSDPGLDHVAAAPERVAPPPP